MTIPFAPAVLAAMNYQVAGSLSLSIIDGKIGKTVVEHSRLISSRRMTSARRSLGD
jgi:hypothetical protein